MMNEMGLHRRFRPTGRCDNVAAPSGLAALLVLLTITTAPVHAQTNGASDVPAAERASGADPASAPMLPPPPIIRGCCSASLVIEATRADGVSFDIDGYDDEEVWSRAAIATDFVQFQPDEGAASTERTEARVVYGDRALYVYLHAFESDPDAVVGQLTRRDQESHSDLLSVVIDSYFDRRTAFQFAVNPVGVKHDIYRFDDTQEDAGWDAVWDVATRRTAEGWAAEFEIPYSQLRFRDAPVQTWGINFVRDIARRQEMAVWAPTTRSDGAIVSLFGELRGLEGLSAPNRLELLPYTLASLERAPGDAQNPFYSPNAAFGTGGVDAKYGLTSNLTLDVTVNPDFGQVEADPAQVNLSALETFLPERRPFFVEGASIFNFSIAQGDGPEANESLFYSRRIGRSPQGFASPAGGYVEVDDRTTILGAWKLSGKTAGGWSIGAMHALTGEERANVSPGTGAPYEEAVEPLSNYAVLRLQKDFREGRSAIGMIGTGTVRNGEVARQLGLRSNAWTGGVDFRHRFASNEWQVNGYVLGSRIAGSEASIAAAQRAPARYFQRPDAGHLEYDPTRTSLGGVSTSFAISKFSGGFWRVGAGSLMRSPGFETNDVGFQNRADFVNGWGWLGYHHTAEHGPFRNWNLNLNGWSEYDFDGNRTATGGNVNLNGQFKNFWHAYMGVNQDLGGFSNGKLRGGPLYLRERRTNFWTGFGTDSRKAIQVNMNMWGNIRPASDSEAYGFSPNVRIRPSGRATFNLGAFINLNDDDSQWVGVVEADTPRYVFARIDQQTVGLTARVDYAFTPTLSLQLYAQPFVSDGSYGAFKQVGDPVAAAYADRFDAVEVRVDGSGYLADLDGDGTEEAIRNPDFNVKQFRSNAVLRWEYLPGSSLFLVWSQGRNHFTGTSSFDFADNVGELFSAPAENVFMVKVSYWMSR